jgi:ADP-ribosylglycohydrolase
MLMRTIEREAINMYGAILGDIIGSPYEFGRGNKSKEFPLFSPASTFTDDTVMTIAVAESVMDLQYEGFGPRKQLIGAMKRYGRMFPNAGYGARFARWLFWGGHEPYNSWGNGSAMRVSSIGWLYDHLEDVRAVARLSAEVTHNHPEGIKGAEATASAIFFGPQGLFQGPNQGLYRGNFPLRPQPHLR